MNHHCHRGPRALWLVLFSTSGPSPLFPLFISLCSSTFRFLFHPFSFLLFFTIIILPTLFSSSSHHAPSSHFTLPSFLPSISVLRAVMALKGKHSGRQSKCQSKWSLPREEDERNPSSLLHFIIYNSTLFHHFTVQYRNTVEDICLQATKKNIGAFSLFMALCFSQHASHAGICVNTCFNIQKSKLSKQNF